MAAIYKRHIRSNPGRLTSAFPFNDDNFASQSPLQFASTDIASMQPESIGKGQSSEKGGDNSNIFNQMNKFTASFRSASTECSPTHPVCIDDQEQRRSPLWCSDGAEPLPFSEPEDSANSCAADNRPSSEGQPPLVGYTIETLVENDFLTHVNVTKNPLSPRHFSFECLKPSPNSDPSSSAPTESDDASVAQSLSSEDGTAVAKSDQPNRYQLRERRQHKTGGLFPRDLTYCWSSSDSSDAESENDSFGCDLSEVRPENKKPSDDLTSENPKAVADIKEVSTQSNGSDVTQKTAMDDNFHRVKASDLKLVLRRNKRESEESKKNGMSLVRGRPFGTKKKRKLRRKFTRMKRKSAVEVASRRWKWHNVVNSRKVSDKLRTRNMDKVQSSEVTAAARERDLPLDCNDEVQSTSSARAKNTQDDVPAEEQVSDTKPLTSNEATQPDAERAPTSTMVHRSMAEDKETELRLAMEFPRHNWLLKHIRKEQMLKNNNTDVSSSNCSKPTSSKAAAVVMNIDAESAEAEVDPKQKLNTQSDSSPKKFSTIVSTSIPPSLSLKDATNDVTENVCSVTISNEGSHAVSIVKPFHYRGTAKLVHAPDKLSPSAEPPLKRRRLESAEERKEISSRPSMNLKKNEKSSSENILDCSTQVDVKIGNYFSLAGADNALYAPLDLTVKGKQTPQVDCALDLSRHSDSSSTTLQPTSKLIIDCRTDKIICSTAPSEVSAVAAKGASLNSALLNEAKPKTNQAYKSTTTVTSVARDRTAVPRRGHAQMRPITTSRVLPSITPNTCALACSANTENVRAAISSRTFGVTTVANAAQHTHSTVLPFVQRRGLPISDGAKNSFGVHPSSRPTSATHVPPAYPSNAQVCPATTIDMHMQATRLSTRPAQVQIVSAASAKSFPLPALAAPVLSSSTLPNLSVQGVTTTGITNDVARWNRNLPSGVNKSSNASAHLYDTERHRKRSADDLQRRGSSDPAIRTSPFLQTCAKDNVAQQLRQKAEISATETNLKKMVSPAPKTSKLQKIDNNTIIDVDALYDDLPSILPRHKNKFTNGVESKASVGAMPLKTQAMTPNPQFSVPNFMQLKAPSSLQYRKPVGAPQAPATRSKSLDSFQTLPLAVNKPNSAPPMMPMAQRFPKTFNAPMMTKGKPGKLDHQSVVQTTMELRRPPIVDTTINCQHAISVPKRFTESGTAKAPQASSCAKSAFTNTVASAFPRLTPSQSHVSKMPNGIRIPIKPTPINYHQMGMLSQRHALVPPTGSYPVRVTPTFSSPTLPSCTPVQHPRQKVVPPRPSVVRAPPGGVSINSTPIRVQPQVDYNHARRGSTTKQATANDKGLASFPARLCLSPEQAQNIAVQLQVERRELEIQMNKLKNLEKSLMPSPHPPRHQQLSMYPRTSNIPVPNPAKRGPYLPRSNAHPHLTSFSNPYPRKTIEKVQLQSPTSGVYQPLALNQQYPSAEEKCAGCQQRAYFVCSGCRTVWYCSKACQFQDWNKHCNHCH